LVDDKPDRRNPTQRVGGWGPEEEDEEEDEEEWKK